MKPKLQMIRVNEKDKTIYWGDLYKQETYIRDLDYKKVKSIIGCYDNKQATKKLGISPSKFARMVKGAQYRVYIKDDHELISKLCMRREKNKWDFDGFLVQAFHKKKNLIKEYVNDGNINILPIGFNYRKNTKELKAEFPKKAWKELNKNSFSRNKLLAEHLSVYKKFYLNKVSSCILKKSEVVHFLRNESSALWLDNYLRKNKILTKIKTQDMIHLAGIASDTASMAERLGKKFKIDWTLDQLNKKHDEFTKLISINRYPDVFIDSLKNVKVKEFSDGNYTGILLDTPFKINSQGIDQHHCVGSYVDQVKSGNYLVYDIKENGKTVSTLGVIINKNTDLYSNRPLDSTALKNISYRYSQHYGFGNSHVSEELKEFGHKIVEELNRIEK